MKKLFLLLLFCHISSPVKHSLKFFCTASSGVPNFPEFMGFFLFDDILVGSCDSNNIELKQDWVKKTAEDDPREFEFYIEECFKIQPNSLKESIHILKQHFNQSGGVHILQRIHGCEWDDETGGVNGFNLYGYDGEDFLVFDLKTLTWITPKSQAVTIKERWDAEEYITTENKQFLSQICPEWLKKYLYYWRSSLLRTDLPSVSLLQKTPSSPVSCHATGFFPDRAMMFWRKDGEELHEDVDHGEILPNNDGSFQMSVDLKPPSVTPEDWRRYDCVFHLFGTKDNIVTKLDKAEIRTNWGKDESRMPIIAAVVVLAVGLIAVIGFIVYKNKKAYRLPSCPHDECEFSPKLIPETQLTNTAQSDVKLTTKQ